MYLVPTKIIPDERQVVCYVEGAVFVEERELAAATGPAREPDHHGVVLLAPRLEEEVEHPTRDEREQSDMGRCVNKGGGPRRQRGREEVLEEEETGKLTHLASWVLGRR